MLTWLIDNSNNGLEYSPNNAKIIDIASNLVGTCLSTCLFIAPIVVSLLINANRMDIWRPYADKYLTTSTQWNIYVAYCHIREFLIIGNVGYTLVMYMEILVLGICNILKTQHFIIKRQQSEFNQQNIFRRSIPINFETAFRTHRMLRILMIFINEIGEYVLPFLLLVSYFLCVLSGTATILGSSTIQIPPTVYPLFPALLTIIFIASLSALPTAALVHENSVLFKTSWKCGKEGRRFKKQLLSCREIRVVIKGMGFIDRSFIMTYLDGILNNIVGVVVFVAGERDI